MCQTLFCFPYIKLCVIAMASMVRTTPIPFYKWENNPRDAFRLSSQVHTGMEWWITKNNKYISVVLEHPEEHVNIKNKEMFGFLLFKEHLILIVICNLYFYIKCRWMINFKIGHSGALFTFLIEDLAEEHKAQVKFDRISEGHEQPKEWNISLCHIHY